jgi:hypothetical protein
MTSTSQADLRSRDRIRVIVSAAWISGVDSEVDACGASGASALRPPTRFFSLFLSGLSAS